MAKIKEIKEVAIDDLIPYERNAKLHPYEQVEKIADSIKEFGFISPVLIDLRGNVIAGHGRIEAAKMLGMKKVPCVEIGALTEAQRRAYILADNRLTELGGWDMDLVMEELEDLEAMDFNIEVTGFELDIEPAEASEDDFDEMVESVVPRVHRGEVWQLGRHRLVCGDSTFLEDVKKCIGGVLLTF